MTYRLMLSALLIILALPARADTPEAAFGRISACISKQDTEACRTSITASSVAIYDRFVSYGLVACLPKKSAYVSQQQKNGQSIVRAEVTSNETDYIMRLIFSQEEGLWKLDVPESLHLGMGDKWEQQINVAEQLFLMLRPQMGAVLNCKAIEALAPKKKPKAKPATPAPAPR